MPGTLAPKRRRWRLPLLLLALLGAFLFVGWHSLRGAGALAREQALNRLQADAEAAAARLAQHAAEMALALQDGGGGAEGRYLEGRIGPDGSLTHPPVPRRAPALKAARFQDPMGAFFLKTGQHEELVQGRLAEARALYLEAAHAERASRNRAIAEMRLAVLEAQAGALGLARIRRERALTLLSGAERRTREALAMRLSLPSEREALADDAAALLGGPDDAIGRGLIEQLGPPAQPAMRRHRRLQRQRAQLLNWLPAASERNAGAFGLRENGPDTHGLILLGWRMQPEGDWLLLAEAGLFVRPPLCLVHQDSGTTEGPRPSVNVPVGSRLPGATVVGALDQGSLQEAVERARWGALWPLALAALGVLGATVASWRSAAKATEAASERALLLSHLGHELRTPVASIRLLAETLEGHKVQDFEEVREFAAMTRAEAERLGALVERSLELGRLGSLEAPRPQQRLDIGRCLSEALATEAPLMREASLTVDCQIEEELGEALGDSDALRGAFQALFENVRRHAVAGGLFRVVARKASRGVDLLVEDAGPGIPESHHERIFERFARGPDARLGGSGLGLAIVREVLSAHGGKVSVGRSPEGGASFHVQLPLAERDG